MAAASSYRITVNGVQAHGSRPWDSIDPIMATAQLIESLNTVVSRRINIINNPAVISVGMVQAGTRNNIIPDKSQITGTIRTFDPDCVLRFMMRLQIGGKTDSKAWKDMQGIWNKG